MKHTAPYGSWVSPITESSLVEGRIGIGETVLDGDAVYWSESRPMEGGRVTLMRRDAHGDVAEILPAPYCARTTVHEYGGGAFTVVDGIVYFSNYEDQRLYRLSVGGTPEPLTPAGKQRFADLVLDRRLNRLICVRENHEVPVGTQAVNELVAVPLDGGAVDVLVGGADFYASPRLNAAGTRLAWLSWDHPNMPWDHTRLEVANCAEDGTLEKAEVVAGIVEESVFQPAWAEDGALIFVADREGWWNLYRYEPGVTTPLHPMAAEFGKPQWSFGTRTYGFASYNRLIVSYGVEGTWHLAGLDPKTGSLTDYKLPYTALGGLSVAGSRAVFVGASPTRSPELVVLDLDSGITTIAARTASKDPDPRYTSVPEAVTFPTDNGLEAHGFYYPPANADYQAPTGSLPPMITVVHGGPTSASSASFSLNIQYWTSRGFAVFDVNHGGSTGYGRAYRNRLKGQWGVVDVADAAGGAAWLASIGKADADKLIIRGGSAGGYTTLAALTFQDVFKAGASYYGISDLVLLARETHKFESRYPDQLIGPYPEREDLYIARSPIHHLEGLDRPVILLQGLEDKVVPPNQSERILHALKDRGVPVAYVPFAGEQHGFRKAENIIRAYKSELYFYARVLGFDIPAGAEPVDIYNLPKP